MALQERRHQAGNTINDIDSLDVKTIMFTLLMLLLLVYFGFVVVYLFYFSIMGFKRTGSINKSPMRWRRIALLIPAYKEDQVIVRSALQALKQRYPRGLFDVTVIADSCKPETICKLRSMPIRLIEVSFERSTKAKALKEAMIQLDEKDYDACVILDADNVMATDFLYRINRSFDAGYVAVQGHRVAKNTNTRLALLDAVSEEVNNWIFRKGHVRSGLSAALIGSGMGFRFSLFKELILKSHAVGGFDKELELNLLKRRVRIGYIEEALVYDEKVQKDDVFVPQRTRWISAQLHYAREQFFSCALEGLSRSNLDLLDKAIQLILPPRIILVGLLPVFSALAVITQTLIVPWLCCLVLFVVALVLSIPGHYRLLTFKYATGYIPRAIWLMVKSIWRSPGANKTFIHTPHGLVQSGSNGEIR